MAKDTPEVAADPSPGARDMQWMKLPTTME